MTKFFAEEVVATWSGGIDSTAVIANLLEAGWKVTAVTLEFGPPEFVLRERAAREALLPHLLELGDLDTEVLDGSWLWAFSPDGVEIPTRNRRIMDHLIAAWCTPRDVKNLAMGEYIGCDTWVVQDHVGAADCDARSLTAYLYEQYGLRWRLITLADFGESRYKSDRLQLGADVFGAAAMALTTNCLNNASQHCGRCYKCIERAAAFDVAGLPDATEYTDDPRADPAHFIYLRQMRGAVSQLSADSFA